MIYNNPFPGQEIVYTCSNCGGTFRQGNMACLMMHYGSGCCHYGEKPVVVTEAPKQETANLEKALGKLKRGNKK